MTRNTHNRSLDHHGVDFSNNISLYHTLGYPVSTVSGSSLDATFDAIVATVSGTSMGMLPQYGSAPASPAEGVSYYDTVLHMSRTWNGSAWKDWWT